MKAILTLALALGLGACAAVHIDGDRAARREMAPGYGRRSIPDGQSEAYVLTGSSLPDKRQPTKIWTLIDFFAPGSANQPIQFDGTDALFSESIAPGQRPRPAYFRVTRSGANLIFTLCDQAGTSLAVREIATHAAVRERGALAFEHETDRQYDYHGTVGTAHDSDSFEFSLSTSGNLVIEHRRRIVSPSAVMLGVAPVSEERSTVVFEKRRQ